MEIGNCEFLFNDLKQRPIKTLSFSCIEHAVLLKRFYEERNAHGQNFGAILEHVPVIGAGGNFVCARIGMTGTQNSTLKKCKIFCHESMVGDPTGFGLHTSTVTLVSKRFELNLLRTLIDLKK